MRRNLLGYAALSFLVAACGPTFESAGTLKGVRIIGVQKDTPYVAPGGTVKLSMLLFDGADTKRKVSVKWFGGCDNPPGDTYLTCFRGAGAETDGETLGGLRLIGEGLETAYTVPDDILDRAVPPGDVVPYGMSFVFFTACTGSLQPAPGERIPIQCVDDDGARVDANGFVVGYSQIFAYQELTNNNPVIDGLTIRGEAFKPEADSPVECIGQDCVEIAKREFGIAAENPESAPDGGAPPDPPTGGGGDAGVTCDPATQMWCVDRCTEEKFEDCPGHPIQVSMTEEKNNDVDDTSTSASRGEQMWVNYYIEGGKLDGDIKIVRDATEGWQGDRSDTKFFAPKTEGPFHLWAAAHDNRGGVQWVRSRLYAR